jgi:hypothetical protein
VGSAAVLESLDDSVRGSKALSALLPVPVLAVVPYMETVGRDSASGRSLIVVVAAITF